MIPQIPIQNLYYLLCYAWDVSDLQHKVKVDGDNCHSLENLLAMVLLNACDHLLRRGLIREYRYEEQDVEGVKGKLNIAETLKSGKYRQGRTICQVDELSTNVIINQIIYSTLQRLAKLENLELDIRDKARNTQRMFPPLMAIPVSNRTFDKVKLHRNNRFYSLVLNICKLIWKSTLPIQGKVGKYEFIDFTQDEFRMNAIFERFLMNFCKKHCKEEYPEVHREYIYFQLSPFGMMFEQAGEALPTMETDVTLCNPTNGSKKILDAKYYKETLLSKYGGREKIRREHLSQILSYVMNQEDKNKPYTLNASGTLVYPTVTEDYDFSFRYKDTGHTIHVKTVNLNQDWQKIEQRIKDIIR